MNLHYFCLTAEYICWKGCFAHYRYALDAEIQRYVSESYPKGMSAVNCVKGKDTEGPGSDFELVVIITAMRLSPQNFWW